MSSCWFTRGLRGAISVRSHCIDLYQYNCARKMFVLSPLAPATRVPAISSSARRSQRSGRKTATRVRLLGPLPLTIRERDGKGHATMPCQNSVDEFWHARRARLGPSPPQNRNASWLRGWRRAVCRHGEPIRSICNVHDSWTQVRSTSVTSHLNNESSPDVDAMKALQRGFA